MAYTREELDQMNVTAKELAEAIERRSFPEMPPDMLKYREARAAHLSKLRHMMPVPGPIPEEVHEKEIIVTARDGYSIKVIVYTPAKNPSSQPGPLILLFHEGGWVMGDLTDEEFNARLFTRELGATCVNVEYRLAPEHQFPTGINDAWDVVQWAATTASPSSPTLSADPEKGFIVGGSSAGGNLSAILAHLSRNTNLHPPVTGQWLSVPYIMDITQVPTKYREQFISPLENDHDPILGHTEVTSTSPLFDTVKPDLHSPLLSPMCRGNYPNDTSKPPLARAFFQVAGLDPLRDHGLVYAQILRDEYAVDTKVSVYPGYSHMFWTNWPELQASRQFAVDMLQGFRWLLEKK